MGTGRKEQESSSLNLFQEHVTPKVDYGFWEAPRQSEMGPLASLRQR